jgi:mannose-1-phosphate guanylyltransferase
MGGLILQVIILAGGLGTRLRPLTDTRAKPLLPVMNKPMIMHILDKLPAEVDKIILTVSYRKKDLEIYFNENDIGKEIIVVDEPKPLGTGGAIRNAEKYIDDTFAVYNADIISSMNLTNFVDFHKRRGGIGSIAIWPVKDPSAFGLINLDYQERILSFTEKIPLDQIEIEQDYYLINAGSYILELEIMDYIDKGRKLSIERDVFPYVIDKNLYGFKLDGYWFDSGTPELYLSAHEKLLGLMSSSGKGVALGKNTEIETGVALLPPVLLGNGCKISHNAHVGPNVCLGNHVSIDINVNISNAVIFDYTHIGAGLYAKDIIFGEGCRIQKGAKIKDGTVLGDGTVIKANK